MPATFGTDSARLKRSRQKPIRACGVCCQQHQDPKGLSFPFCMQLALKKVKQLRRKEKLRPFGGFRLRIQRLSVRRFQIEDWARKPSRLRPLKVVLCSVEGASCPQQSFVVNVSALHDGARDERLFSSEESREENPARTWRSTWLPTSKAEDMAKWRAGGPETPKKAHSRLQASVGLCLSGVEGGLSTGKHREAVPPPTFQAESRVL